MFALVGWLPAPPRTALAARPTETTGATGPSATVFVHFKLESSAAERAAAITAAGGELLAWLPELALAHVRLAHPDQHRRAGHVQLANHPLIELVEANPPVQAAFVPDDPDLFAQSQVYAPQLLNLFAAWEYTTGSPTVTIAILDTGLAHAHPEFAGRILPGYDFINSDADPEDDHGHGTHVAGIAAANINNGTGAAGVCGECRILPVKVLNQYALGSHAGVVAGLHYAIEQEAQVIVLSLTSLTGTSAMNKAVAYARAKGAVIVAAAGNSNVQTPTYPAAYTGVLAVSATDRRDQRWPQSNYGPYVDIAAPGDNIYSTYHELQNEYNGYLLMSGTSMSTPFVGGLAGLLLAQDPTRTAAEVERLILSTAVDLGEPGPDVEYGAGRIDPVAALAAEAPVPLTTAMATGKVWQAEEGGNPSGITLEAGVVGAEITLHDAAARLIGLAPTHEDGEWRFAFNTPAVYTASVIMPPNVIATAITTTRFAVTSTATLPPINFRAGPAPTAEDVRDFQVQRSIDQVRLSWTIEHQFVRTVSVERATTADGVYTLVGSLEMSVVGAADRQNEFVDTLPSELSDAVLYYRILLNPGEVPYGPVSTTPQAKVPQLFLPSILH
jgi:thermitase